jgi:hypothetical protein
MRLLLRCLIVSAVLSPAVFGLLFVSTNPKIGSLILPALWLASKVFGSFVATNDSGLSNLVSLLPFAFLLNILLYAVAFFLLVKIACLTRPKKGPGRSAENQTPIE